MRRAIPVWVPRPRRTGLSTTASAARVRVWSGEFRPDRRAVREARATARRLLPWLGYRGELDAPVLIVSELVTNAVEHGSSLEDTALLLRLSVHPCGGLSVEVTDGGTTPPGPPAPPPCPEAESGRGLLLVHALGARTTWEQAATGKTMRAFLPLGGTVPR
ncbi:ATP-binding protein [Streptomyces sp. YIM 103828]|uniref:ATP-binding protein n=1 Tax=Streptomyces sp. YIM 103828 TaxID=3158968 RepID=UPI0024146342|nr:ATP-binding protein [Streptomyces albidoflavus]